MTEKNILDKIKAECNASAPDNFSEIENQIKTSKKNRRNIILKISAAAAVIAVPFLSVIASQRFKPMGPEDIKLADVTVDTSEYTEETDDNSNTTKPVSEKETEESTVTVPHVESQMAHKTENGLKTELPPQSQSITKNQTQKESSHNIPSTEIIPTTTKKVHPDISDKPHTSSTRKPSHTTKPVVSSEIESPCHTILTTNQEISDNHTSQCITEHCPYETTSAAQGTQPCSVPQTLPKTDTTKECTVPVSFTGYHTECTTKECISEQLLSVNLIFAASQDDHSGNSKSKIYEGKDYNYIVTDYDLYNVQLNYSRHSEIYSIDEVLKKTKLTIDDLIEAGLNATKIEK